jgi:DNA polymerase beta palm
MIDMFVSITNDRYRRGKPQSNDVDIVITHMDAKSGAAKIKGLCKKFVRRLYERGQSPNDVFYDC